MEAEETAIWDVANIWFGKLNEKQIIANVFLIFLYFQSKAFHVVIAVKFI
jgi:hypothetical protein